MAAVILAADLVVETIEQLVRSFVRARAQCTRDNVPRRHLEAFGKRRGAL